MRFEITNALRDLDERTPEFVRRELFAHGSLKVRGAAIEVLTTLDPSQGSARLLREMISIT